MVGRVNSEGYGATASLLENLLCESAGPMSLRPGLAFMVEAPAVSGDDDLTVLEEFVYAPDQKYLPLFTHQELRIVEDGGIVVRASVMASVANSTFAAGLASWTNFTTGGSSAEGGVTGLVLHSDGPSDCGVRQEVACPNPGVVHGLRLLVSRGPVTLRLGSTSGQDDLIGETELRTGEHRLGFTPTSSFWIELSSSQRRDIIVTSCQVEAAGDLVLSSPWEADAIRTLKFTQDLDVMYVADGARTKRRLERRSAASWSLTLADEQDGPFGTPNINEAILLTPSTRRGNGSIMSTKAMFRTGDVGSLIRITQNGQYQQRAINGADQWSDPIRVTGVGDSRSITWEVSGTYSGTVRLQRSIGNDNTWEDTSGGTGTQSTTGTGAFAYADGQDNVLIYYRVGIKVSEYTSGTADVTIFHAGGATDGVARITAYTSDSQVEMEVLSAFASLAGSNEWARGAWSDYLGHPKSAAIHDGRMWNGMRARFWGSVSGTFESHREGDEAADGIASSVAIGSQAQEIRWLMGLQRLLVGTAATAADVQPIVVQTGLVTVQSSQFDEALTPANVTVRGVDQIGLYVDQSGNRAMEVRWDGQSNSFRASSLMRLHRDLGRGGIKQLAFAQRPDPRIFMIRADGQCLVKLYDTQEAALGWCRLITNGLFESVAVLPGDAEDEVYFLVRRTIDGVERRFIEKMDPLYLADIEEANRLDSFVRYEGAAATNIPAGFADHLIGSTVKVVANGAYMGENTIDAQGQLTEPLGTARTKITVGLSYRGRYKSSKLAFGAQAGTAVAQLGKPSAIAFCLTGSVRQVRYGQDFELMDKLPGVAGDDIEYGEAAQLEDVTTDFMPIPGDHGNDPRLCLEINAPHPVTIQGFVVAHDLAEEVRA